MNDFIKAIFLCDTCGVEKIRLPLGKDYQRLNKKEDELYEKLKASPELFKVLDDFIKALLDRHAIISEQYYTAGFKIALRLAIPSTSQTFLICKQIPRRLLAVGG